MTIIVLFISIVLTLGLVSIVHVLWHSWSSDAVSLQWVKPPDITFNGVNFVDAANKVGFNEIYSHHLPVLIVVPWLYFRSR